MMTEPQHTQPAKNPPTVGVDIMSEEFDNVIGRPAIVNQTIDYMNSDRQYGIRDPKTGLLQVGTIHGPGHIESCEELGPEWHYHSSKPENQPVYRYNSMGHRNAFNLKDLPDREFGIAFGCSFTEGIGLKEENIFHQKVSRDIDLPIYSCAISGASNDVSYWNFTQIMRRYKPAVVLYQLTSSTRFLMNAHAHNKIQFTFGILNDKPEFLSDMFDFAALANKLKYDTLRTQMQMQSVKTLCKVTNTKLVFLDVFNEFNSPDKLILPIFKDIGCVSLAGIERDEARDRWHSGINYHKHIADQFIEFLNNC